MAGDSAVATAAKPQMRGLLNAVIKRNLIVALVLSGLSGVAFKVVVGDSKKQRYAKFYRNYDADKDFEEMKAKGVFQSC